MNMKRMLGAGLGAGIVSNIFAGLTCGWLFNWVYQLEPTNVWKLEMGEAPGPEVMGVMVLLTVVLAFVYALINKGLPGKNRYIKGLVFGMLVWLVGIVPGMYATFTFMTVATTVVVYWLTVGLVDLFIKGVIIAAIYGE